MPTDTFLKVYLERGKRSTFAAALDWPGWCRRGRSPEDAIAELQKYRPRYQSATGISELPLAIDVIGEAEGDATTDFGAPSAIGPWDQAQLELESALTQAAIVASCWEYFDLVSGNAPEELRKGPRGGGRDTSKVIEHVRNAERAYAGKIDARLPKGEPWHVQRDALLTAFRADAKATKWPVGYAMRRIAWHVLDHAWEIEDKSGPST